MEKLRRLRTAVRDQAKPLIAQGRSISKQRQKLRQLEHDLRLNQNEIKRTVERLRIAHRALLQAEQKNKAGWSRVLTGAERKSVRLQKQARRLVAQASKHRTGKPVKDRLGWFAALKTRVKATLGRDVAEAKGSVTVRTDRLSRADLKKMLGNADRCDAVTKRAVTQGNKPGRGR